MFRIVKFIICIFLLQFSSVAFSQQKEPADSLVRLIEAQSAKLENINGISYRRIVGPARFLHNNTYLLCDTAIWNVDTNIIDAVGNVQIIQENTFLKSDKIEYVVNENTAKFRGNLVELFDREGNILKTNFLDYNTKDSIAVFYGGAALKSSDGNIIESDSGRYESSFKLFTFTDNVNMFTDSVFIKSDKIQYNTDINTAFFGEGTTAWKDDNIFCTNDGELDRPQKIFTFKKDSYILTRDQEVWADTLKYYNSSGEAELRRNVQLLDTTKTSFCLADEVLYYPKPMKVELRKNPVVGLYSYEEGVADTLFFIADSITYYKRRYCDINPSEIEIAKERLKLSKLDPIADIELEGLIARGIVKNPKSENSSESNKNIGEKNNLNKAGIKGSIGLDGNTLMAKSNSTTMLKDSLNENIDSLANALDSLGLSFKGDTLSIADNNLDTTEITFIDAIKNVKFYRSNLQGLCDTLLYNSLDSIARLYSTPVIWNDKKNQFSADSIQAIITNNALNKINLLSNALILSQEKDTSYYNQIKSTEMTAFFKDNELYRFDALGGASAIVFMAEDSLISLMNQKNSKMLTASIKDRVIQRVKYIQEIKEDVFPVYNLTPDAKKLRGFNWRGSEMPTTRFELTKRSVKPTKREEVKGILFPNYIHTGFYFPEMRKSIFEYKRYSDSVLVAKELEREKERLAKKAARDSANKKAIEMDSLKLANSMDSLLVKDSLSKTGDISVKDSLSTKENKALTKKELRAKEKAEKKQLRAEKRAKRKELRALKREKRRELRELRRKERIAKREARKQAREVAKLKKENLNNTAPNKV